MIWLRFGLCTNRSSLFEDKERTLMRMAGLLDNNGWKGGGGWKGGLVGDFEAWISLRAIT